MIIEVHKDKDLNFKMETEIFDVRLLGPRAHARQKPADLALNLFERHPYSLLDYAAIAKEAIRKENMMLMKLGTLSFHFFMVMRHI